MKTKTRGIKIFQTEEELRRDIIEKLQQSEAEIEKGEVIEAKVYFKEMRQKYGY